ncbi:MAG TPA: hypothetical protein VJ576_02740 [Rhodocyclaceae bacterium]|nr:hypothetical protein [Rhodocyclaceae bacterium]
MSVTILFFLVVGLLSGAGLGLSVYNHDHCVAGCYEEMARMERRRDRWAMVGLACLVVMAASAGALTYPLAANVLAGF